MLYQVMLSIFRRKLCFVVVVVVIVVCVFYGVKVIHSFPKTDTYVGTLECASFF